MSNAYCLIPPTMFPKGLPVSASIRLPAGAVEVLWWFIVAPRMQEQETFSGIAEVRWRSSAGNFADSTVTSVRVGGEPHTEPGGIEGQPPATLPNDAVMFQFDPRDSGGGGAPPDPGAEWVRVTMIPQGGNNGGGIWCGCVIAATDENGESLTFDQTTRGS
jgi:hypothetical protein